jgi:peptide/nickel transport system permease protein
MSKLFRSRLVLAGGIMSLSVVIIAIIAPLIAPYGSSEFTDDLLRPPSGKYFLGTDDHGQDLLSRILRGSRITLFLAVTITAIAALFGVLWGLMAAYTSGVAAILFNRAIDVGLSFPSVMTALLVLAIVGAGGKTALIIAIVVSHAPRFARVIRGATLPLLEEDFILAERAVGAGHLTILGRHLVPNLIAPITVLISIDVPGVILLESALSFLGLGAPPDVPTWGRIIADGKGYIEIAPWLTIFPGLAILFTSLSFNVLGDGLRDIFDPRSATRLYKKG